MQEQSSIEVNSRNKLKEQILAYPWIGVLVGTVLFVILFSVFAPGTFFTTRNQFIILRAASVYLIIGVGQTLVITTAGIDLSTGSILGLTAALVGTGMQTGTFGPIMAIILAVIIGGLLGSFNGFTITYLKVPPLLATLGTFIAYRGIAAEFMGIQLVTGLPTTIVAMGRGMLFGIIPYPVIMALIAVAAGYFVLTKTLFGRYITAVGNSEYAARAARINPNKIKMAVYTLQGAMAGFAGLILMGRLDSVGPQMGEGIELHVIAGVILGGTYLFGGKGTVFGTLVGMYLIGALENGLIQMGFGFFIQMIVLGFLIIAAVAFQTKRAESDY